MTNSPSDSPSDNTTLSAVVAGYEQSGFTATFSPRPDGRIECVSCGTELPAAVFTLESLRRLEGASDPDDMIAVVALVCPVCAAKGTMVLGYGPMASPDDSDILGTLRDRRGEASLPPDASPSDARRTERG